MLRVAARAIPSGDAEDDGDGEGNDKQDFERRIACGGDDALRKRYGKGRMLCQRERLRASGRLSVRKKEAGPEGAGLPGVVPFDIVNWEGNYILDTNTFLIVTSHR